MHIRKVVRMGLVLAGVFLGGVLFAQEKPKKEAGIENEKANEKAKDFTLGGLTGNTVTLFELKGWPVIVHFWTTWCPPCREEFPSLVKAAAKFPKIKFIAINVQEEKEIVEQFARTIDGMSLVFLDPAGKVAADYGVSGFPTTFIIDDTGTVLARLDGSLDWQSEDVEKLLSLFIEESTKKK